MNAQSGAMSVKLWMCLFKQENHVFKEHEGLVNYVERCSLKDYADPNHGYSKGALSVNL